MADENGETDTILEDSSLLTQGSVGDTTHITEDSGVEDPELEAIKARVREMEEEAEKLKEMQTEVDKQMNMSSPTATPAAAPFPTPEEKQEADNKSIYVGNVDYGATAEELEQHFHGCGSVNRVTILCDKYTGHPKGFAYIEFADKDSVITAMALDESLFRGRQIKVVPKRTNRPGISTTNRRPRGRGGVARGVARGMASYYAGAFTPRGRRPFGIQTSFISSGEVDALCNCFHLPSTWWLSLFFVSYVIVTLFAGGIAGQLITVPIETFAAFEKSSKRI